MNDQNARAWMCCVAGALCVALVGCGGDGADGMNGMDGAPGQDGMNGAPGDRGPNGEDGADGADGNDGADGEDGAPGQDGAPGYARATLYVSLNGANNAGQVQRVSESYGVTRTLEVGNNEGVLFTPGGALVQAGDRATGASLRTFCATEWRAEGAAFDPQRDRELIGAQTGLVNPKGIALARRHGYILVANLMGGNVQVFGSAAAGDAAPVAQTALPGQAWDLLYDEVNDRLFVALTNGDLTVHDNYIEGGFGEATRTITPSDDAAAKISVNLHGLAYDRSSDRMVISDVGDAASATDGQLFVIDAVSTASGNVSVSRRISGPSTRLGNPVDIVMTGADVRVAEKANDVLLVFNDIFSGPSGDIAPSLSVPSVKPESLAIYEAPYGADVSELSSADTVIPFITVSSNPALDNAPSVGQIARMTSALNASVGAFDTALRAESVTFDLDGDAYITFDDGDDMNGGVLIAGRVAHKRDGEAMTPTRDRMITGPATGLVAPKGLDVSTRAGLLFVTDVNPTTPAVRVFSLCAAGDVAPLANVDLNGGRPWDVDYDEATDRLFVALTNGDLAVFDQFMTDLGAGGPDRLITPADSGAKISINLHGVDYDAATDSLLLSDVGSAGNASDGQLFVIGGASRAQGLTQVSVRIAGPNSNLGNPVDIAFDGRHLYVAEKANNVIQRFDDILTSDSGDIAPTREVVYPAPESVALNPLR